MTYPIDLAGLHRDLPICRGDKNIFLFLGGFIIAIAMEKWNRSYNVEAYFIARKEKKAYMPDPIYVEDRSITTEGVQRLYLGRDDAALLRGRRVLLVDDVISKGGSMLAMEKLVSLAGAAVAGRAAVLAEGPAALRSDILVLGSIPLFDVEGKPKALQG